MKVSNAVICDCRDKEHHVFIQFIKGPMKDTLFLDVAVVKENVNCPQAAYNSCKFLDKCLFNCLLNVAQDKLVTPRAALWRGNLRLQAPEC